MTTLGRNPGGSTYRGPTVCWRLDWAHATFVIGSRLLEIQQFSRILELVRIIIECRHGDLGKPNRVIHLSQFVWNCPDFGTEVLCAGDPLNPPALGRWGSPGCPIDLPCFKDER